MSTSAIHALLQSTSDVLFPAEMGRRHVTIDSRDVEGDTPLHVLLWRGNVAGARVLIEAGADPNAVGDMGETPLHLAVRQELPDIVSALLAVGADPNVRSEFGQTPRQMAVEKGGPVARAIGLASPDPGRRRV